MSIAYQCWEMGVGSTVGYNKGSALSQYVSENNGSTLRCLSSPSSHHEASFVMYMQQHEPPPQGMFVHSKDMTAVRFAASSSPISATASSPTTLPAADSTPTKKPPVSETNATTSSVTSERSAEEKATECTTPCEAQSKRLEAGVTGTVVSTFPGTLAVDRGKMSFSKAKPGVVEHIIPVGSSGFPFGGYTHGPSALNNEQSSESSSSICQASEDSGSCSSGDTGGEEAQSMYRGPLSTMMSALDESLPIRRPGLSNFFGGKSRSFSSLAEVSTVTELAKPNNPYAKRRKMGFNCPLGEKTKSYPPPTRSSGASIAKKVPSNGSRNTLAVAVILGGLQEGQEQQQAAATAAAAVAPKAEIRTFPSRSYSLTDLPHAGSPPPLRLSLGRP